MEEQLQQKGGVSLDIAEKEVTVWLDFKKVRAEKRESYKPAIKSLAAMISEGTLVLNHETKVFTMTLAFPVGNSGEVKTLDFKPRMDVSTKKTNTNGTEGEGVYVGIIAGLTGKVKNIIQAMDTEDFNAAQNIAIFFV